MMRSTTVVADAMNGSNKNMSTRIQIGIQTKSDSIDGV